jgi:sugar/nucleoside kinase (ribokinase family)
VVDTLGAGDVLHGVAAFMLAGSLAPPTADRVAAALSEAARVAAASCATFGTRAWRAAPIARPLAPSARRAGGRTP